MTDNERIAKDFLFDCRAEMVIVFQGNEINPN